MYLIYLVWKGLSPKYWPLNAHNFRIIGHKTSLQKSKASTKRDYRELSWILFSSFFWGTHKKNWIKIGGQAWKIYSRLILFCNKKYQNTLIRDQSFFLGKRCVSKQSKSKKYFFMGFSVRFSRKCISTSERLVGSCIHNKWGFSWKDAVLFL